MCSSSLTHLMSFCCKFKVWSFNNGIDGTCFLTEPTIYAFCHVDIVPCGSTTSIFSFFCFNSDCLGWANLLNIKNNLNLSGFFQVLEYLIIFFLMNDKIYSYLLTASHSLQAIQRSSPVA